MVDFPNLIYQARPVYLSRYFVGSSKTISGIQWWLGATVYPQSRQFFPILFVGSLGPFTSVNYLAWNIQLNIYHILQYLDMVLKFLF